MDISLDKKNSTEASIKVKLNEADYQPHVEEKVKEYAKKATIKGFRPGKVPVGLIKKMYGKSIIVEEINSLLSSSLSNYIKENGIQIIGEPLPDQEKAQKIDWENQKDFEFDYEIGMVSEFKYDLSDKVKVKSYKIELDKKGMNETLDNVKKQFGNVTNPEVSKEGDSFFGTFQEVDGSISNEALLDWDKIEKKEQKKFVGIKSGDIVEFDIQKLVSDNHDLMRLLDIGHDKAHDIKGKFTFTLKNVNRTEPAEVNQELFDKVFGKDAVKSEKEFTDKIKQTVEENYQRESTLLLNRDIRDHLIEKTKIEVPTEFLKKWLLVSNEGKITQEDIDREFDDYVRSLKWDLLRNKISDENKVNVENAEVVDRAKMMILSQLGGAGAAEQLKDHMDSFADNYLKAENGQNYMKLYNEVREEKLMNLIQEKITLSEKKVNLDEFKKVASN
ncbi:trigger factor [Fulvivirga lutimaris]|uniref:trigger factor n=1 Tax=Fulvivirga lutimaris TaxID=1819566 RepID=UPI0012BD337F|nr:trigger factor [Fulvivirga lutimaris]MTI38585.1 trigger factor [Fulvivirga lutimaris]